MRTFVYLKYPLDILDQISAVSVCVCGRNGILMAKVKDK